MPDPSPEQIARLPRWAQAHIATLLRNLDRSEADRDRLAADRAADTADGWLDVYSHPKPVVPQGERVRFYLAPAVDVPDGLRQRWRKRWVDVRVVRPLGETTRLEIMGDSSLVLRMHAGNVATVDVER